MVPDCITCNTRVWDFFKNLSVEPYPLLKNSSTPNNEKFCIKMCRNIYIYMRKDNLGLTSDVCVMVHVIHNSKS